MNYKKIKMVVKYTQELLNTCISRDNAVLVDKYNNLTRTTRVKFICKCTQEYEKSLICIYNYGAFCKKCTIKNKIKKIKNTCVEKYGVDNPLRCDTFKDKSKETNLKRYGVEYGAQCKEVQEKMKNTCFEKYGVNHVSKTDKFKQKIKDTVLERYGVEHYSKTDEYKEKMKHTILERYGVEHYSKTNEFIDKCKTTCSNRYGVDHYSKTDEYKERCRNTCIDHYGVEHISQAQEIQDKIKQTCLKRYGVENSSQAQEIQEKTQKNARKYKEYIMPSGQVRKVQGYEPFALNELVTQFSEEDILTDRKDIPRIQYVANDKKRYYFPDIYIKSMNKIIEVKSTWTYKSRVDNIKEKELATKEAGYNYEIWVFDHKGNKNIIT